MSATQRLPVLAGITVVGATLAALAASQSGRALIADYLGGWPTVVLLVALVNFKALPFMWHVRAFRAILYHFYIRPTPVPPSSLFEPLITSSYTPLSEIDYNLHKSNSTYFSDLDISRAHLVSCLLRKGIQAASRREDGGKAKEREENRQDGNPVELDTRKDGGNGTAENKGRFSINLGAVSCHFKREIKPYERYEIWTRVLAWDRKWIYLVSHMVKPNAMPERLRPSYTLQPWRNSPRQRNTEKPERSKKADITAKERERIAKAIFATSIAKYVVKKGRLTIAPERVLENSGLLPERPADVPAPTPPTASMTGTTTPAMNSVEGMMAEAVMPSLERVASQRERVVQESDGGAGGKDGEGWTWEVMEKERQRGLKIAEHFAALDTLHNVFVEKVGGDALGVFTDLLW